MNQMKEYRIENKGKISEAQRKWYEENKDMVKDKSSKYYYENKEKILEYQGEKVVCDCGKEIRRQNLLRHKKLIHHPPK